jgi:hypothetical protein
MLNFPHEYTGTPENIRRYKTLLGSGPASNICDKDVVEHPRVVKHRGCSASSIREEDAVAAHKRVVKHRGSTAAGSQQEVDVVDAAAAHKRVVKHRGSKAVESQEEVDVLDVIESSSITFSSVDARVVKHRGSSAVRSQEEVDVLDVIESSSMTFSSVDTRVVKHHGPGFAAKGRQVSDGGNHTDIVARNKRYVCILCVFMSVYACKRVCACVK